MRKEIVCYVETNEEGEEVSVQRVSNDPSFVLIRVGTTRLVLNKAQLLDALGTCDFYGTMFDEEKKQKENKVKLEASRALAKKISEESAASTPKKSSLSKEEEGTIILDQEIRTSPTESELALKKLMEEL